MMAFADDLFELWQKFQVKEDELWDHLERIFKISEGEHRFQDCHWDWYDSSLELDKCDPDFRVTPEQVREIQALGFGHFWTNHTNGLECHYPAKAWKQKSPQLFIKPPPIPWTEDTQLEVFPSYDEWVASLK